ncbi:MAG: CRISPR-associated protein Cmr3 [Leptolyngbya sp. DLM2.Bin15]|nr:MAG: CRISPR-associated protein Cmr3 [Leptolyngbya sp. DLM2.Bin15]
MTTDSSSLPPFQYLITIQPLGLLYGSAGRFLSPENLVGRSGSQFPPSTAVLSGLIAAHYAQRTESKQELDDILKPLCLAGPFWQWTHTADRDNICVPTPMNCLAKLEPQHDETEVPQGALVNRLEWDGQGWQCLRDDAPGKPEKGTWVAINDWEQLNQWQPDHQEPTVYGDPWRYIPHLHPYLMENERRVDTDRERGSLFLENGVQMHPETCLVYLSNLEVEDGWYRFGGEGHMVDLTCHPISENSELHKLLSQPLGKSFALITPAVWGSNRLSYRSPRPLKKGDKSRHQLPEVDSDLTQFWDVAALITERPTTFRYRMGNRKNKQGEDVHQPNQPKALSRGRYAVPSGSVYVLQDKFPDHYATWQDWPLDWFPREGPSLKRWGCGLALPLSGALP